MADDFYKRDIRAAINGMASLTLEERGFYNTLIDHQYLLQAPIKDEIRYLAGMMNCGVRQCKRVRQQLLDKGRISANSDGTLSDFRANMELTKRKHERNIKVSAGKLGGKSSAQSRKINDLGEAETGSASPRGEENREESRGEGSASQTPASKYAFEGTYLKRITEKDLQEFVTQYGTTRERMLATLRRCDEWFTARPDRQNKNWFFSIGPWLEKEDFSKKPAGKVLTYKEREEKAQRDELDALRRIAI